MAENTAYIWMKGQDITLDFTDADGTKGSVNLKFYGDYGLWRFSPDDLPDELPKEPGYYNPPSSGGKPSYPSVPEEEPVFEDGDNYWIMQTGPRSKDTLVIDIGRMNTKILGVDKESVSIATQRKANTSIDIIHKAKNKLSMQRADLGAYQNRIEHKIDNLNNTHENLQAAESLIRDTNMAAYMMQFTKEQVLANASQSMLAQANNIPQGVLQLLG
ncbi:MAG: hypothetical protein IJ446_04500 [Oscillospiraceae bacterium]|nr:hypothetical protein [Oscillospiraceae bacterium]